MTIIFTSKLLGIQTFSGNIIPDSISSYTLLAVTNLFLLANIIMVIHLLKLKWRRKAVVILILYIAYFIAYKYNLLIIKEGWFLVFTTINIFGMYLCVFILDRLYGNVKCR
jgi:hypothetical protein